MAHYPSILFHFTCKDNLYSILDGAFNVSYARESILGGATLKEFGVPMVSFCDLRLSELKDNLGTYGKFGIGMQKEWAINEGLNPVMYASRDSLLTENFLHAIEEFFELVKGSIDTSGKHEMAFNNAMNIWRYIKNYKGDLERTDGSIIPNHVFANEREWRYVPTISEKFPAFVNIDEMKKPGGKALFNQNVKDIKLKFEPGDIKYLIVEKDDDILPLIIHLRNLKVGLTPSTLDRLSSRILTYEQIINDV